MIPELEVSFSPSSSPPFSVANRNGDVLPFDFHCCLLSAFSLPPPVLAEIVSPALDMGDTLAFPNVFLRLALRSPLRQSRSFFCRKNDVIECPPTRNFLNDLFRTVSSATLARLFCLSLPFPQWKREIGNFSKRTSEPPSPPH